MLVVCSTSAQLRTVMINSAGVEVEKGLAGQDLTKTMVETPAGQLKQAKRLLFIPWTPPSKNYTNQDIPALRQSINTFVQHAIKYAVRGRYQSIGE